MNKRIVTHIGYSKCGSSTIQETLVKYYDVLLNNGVLYSAVFHLEPYWFRFFWVDDNKIN